MLVWLRIAYYTFISPGIWLSRSGVLPRKLHFQMTMPDDSRLPSRRWTRGIGHKTWAVFRSSLTCGYFVHRVLFFLGVSSAGQTWEQWAGALRYLYLLLWKRGLPTIFLCRILGLSYGELLLHFFNRDTLQLTCHSCCLWGRSREVVRSFLLWLGGGGSWRVDREVEREPRPPAQPLENGKSR